MTRIQERRGRPAGGPSGENSGTRGHPVTDSGGTPATAPLPFRQHKGTTSVVTFERPQQDSNLRSRLRRALLCSCLTCAKVLHEVPRDAYGTRGLGPHLPKPLQPQESSRAVTIRRPGCGVTPAFGEQEAHSLTGRVPRNDRCAAAVS